MYTNKIVICYFIFSKIFSFSRYRQLLFCRVTLGKSFLQFSAMKMAHSPPGHHSVTGRPSVNGLALAEYVIYRGEQVTRFYLFIFKNTLEPYFNLFLLISTRYIVLRNGFLFVYLFIYLEIISDLQKSYRNSKEFSLPRFFKCSFFF